MTRFIENINTYLSQLKIKQSYISLKTGIDTKKLSSILTGVQDAGDLEMEKIAHSLGQKPEYFLNEGFEIPQIKELIPEKTEFYASNTPEEQEKIIKKLEKLMGNIDEIMSAKNRFLNISRE